MSAGLWLLHEEPQPTRARRRPSVETVVAAVEDLWPATGPRIAEWLGASEPEVDALLATALAAGLIARQGDNYHATDAGLALLAA